MEAEMAHSGPAKELPAIPEEDRSCKSDTPKEPTLAEKSLYVLKKTLAIVLHAVGTGLIGIFIAKLIRHVQILGFGHDNGGFLEIEMETPNWRRMLSVIAGGLIGALSWYWLRGISVYIVSVEECLRGAKMPAVVTCLNAFIQDIVVALGGSFGREAAPREIAAMWASNVAEVFSLTPQDRKIFVACGAGAGLAAVYAVPVSGAVYTIEHVLNMDTSLNAVIPAILTSYIATEVSTVYVESGGLYEMPRYSYDWPAWRMILWAFLIGPLAGVGAVSFRRFVKVIEGYKPLGRVPLTWQEVTDGQRIWLTYEDGNSIGRREVVITSKEQWLIEVKSCDTSEEEVLDEHDWEHSHAEGDRDWTIFVVMPVAFLALALLCHDFPTLLGNGRALAEIAMQRDNSIAFFVMLLFLKALITAAAIGSGAAGGTLTPSVALGATLGAVCGESWQHHFPGLAPEEDAPMSVVAAAAFLAVAMRAPIAATTLLVEFAAQGIAKEDLLAMFTGDFSGVIASKGCVGMLVPMSIAVFLATTTVSRGAWIWDGIWKWLSTPSAPEGASYTPVVNGEQSAESSAANSGEFQADDAGNTPARSSGVAGKKYQRLRSMSMSADIDLLGGNAADDMTALRNRRSQRLQSISFGSMASFEASPLLGPDKATSPDKKTKIVQTRTESREMKLEGLPARQFYQYLSRCDIWQMKKDCGLGLDDWTMLVCYASFRCGLILNTFFTILVIASSIACSEAAAEVSTMAAAVCSLVAPPLVFVWECCSQGQWTSPKTEDSRNLELEAWDVARQAETRCNPLLVVSCPLLAAAAGALQPTLPWVLHVWQDPGGRITGLAACAATAVAAAAQIVVMEYRAAVKLGQVLRNSFAALLAAALACSLGLALGRLPQSALAAKSLALCDA